MHESQRAALAEARADLQLARLVESAYSDLQAQLSRDDAGWQRIGTTLTAEPTASELRQWRLICNQLWVLDPTFARMQNLLLSGALGAKIDPPKAADKRVQKVVDQLWEDLDNQLALFSYSALSSLSIALVLDGEQFLALHTAPGDPLVKMAVVDADEITAVITHPENSRRPLAYRREFKRTRFDWKTGTYIADGETEVRHYRDWRTPDPANPQPDDDLDVLDFLSDVPGLVPDVCVYHVKVNTRWSRGIPLFYRAAEWIRAHTKQLSAMATLSKAQSAIAWKKSLKTSSAAAVQAAAGQFKTGTDGVPGVGAIYASNEAATLDPINIGTGATSNQATTAEHLFHHAIRTLGMGAHWYGDVNQSALATAANTEMPAIWTVEDWQTVLTAPVTDIIVWAVKRLQWARKALLAQQRAAMDDGSDEASEAYLPHTRLDLSLDLNLPPAKPVNDATLGMVIQAIVAAVDADKLDAEEAEYQILERLGASNITEIMRRRAEEREAAKQAAPKTPPPQLVQLAPSGAPTTGEPQPEPASVSESAGNPPDARPSREQENMELMASFDIEEKVLKPWRDSVRDWLTGLHEAPAELRRALEGAVPPSEAATREILAKLHLDAGNLGGREALLKVSDAYRALFGGPVREAAPGRAAQPASPAFEPLGGPEDPSDPERGAVVTDRRDSDGGRTVIYADGSVKRWAPDGQRETLQERLSRQAEWNALLDPEKADGVSAMFNLRDAKLLAELATRGNEITGVVTNTMLDDLHGVLARQFAEGLSPQQIAADIEAIFPLTYGGRGLAIAQTEVHTARGIVQHAALEACGPHSHQWLSSMDARVRDAHRAAHGQVQPIDKPFIVNGLAMMHPGDPAGGASNCIHCRCDEVIVVGEDDDLPPAPWLGEDRSEEG